MTNTPQIHTDSDTETDEVRDIFTFGNPCLHHANMDMDMHGRMQYLNTWTFSVVL